MNELFKGLLERFKEMRVWFSIRENKIEALEIPFQKFYFFIICSTFLWISYLCNATHNEGITAYITNIFIKYWIDPILSKIGTGDISIILTIPFTFLIANYFYAKKIRQYVYSCKTITFYIFIIINYTLLRLVNTSFKFSYFHHNNLPVNIAYFDVIYLLIIPIIYYKWDFIKSQFNKKDNEKKKPQDFNLLNDNPLEKDEEIFPERKIIAEKLSDILKTIQSDSSYAIGINSPWGNGKTTFLNYLLKKLKEKDKTAIFINFSPWFCKTEADIISLFFNCLSAGLKKYHSSINNDILKYAKIILSIKQNTLTKGIGNSLNLFSESKELKTVYEELNKHISNLNRKIYISIDDLDRLYAKEIVECFKIIRNTANFKNIIFILAYDAKYIDRALEESLKKNHKNYIDKIIQLKYALPVIENSALLQFIEEKLEYYKVPGEEIIKIFSYQYLDFFKSQQTKTNKTSTLKLEYYFSNIRDCIKIINLFIPQYQNLAKEINASDLFLVSILKALYPNEALEIYLDMDKFFTPDVSGFKDLDSYKNYLITMDSKSIKTEPRYRIKELNTNDNFINLVQAIFFNTESSIYSVLFNYNFEHYYNGVFPENKVKNSDFVEWIKSAEILIENIKIIKYEKNDKQTKKREDLSYKLNKFVPKDKIQVQIIIHGILYLNENTNTIEQLLMRFKSDYYDILNNILNSKLEIPLMDISSKLEDIKYGIINKISDYHKCFSFDKIQKLSNLTLLKKIEFGKVDKELLKIHRNCVKTKLPIEIDKEANKLIKEFAEANAIEFIKILDIPVDHTTKKLSFNKYIDQIFTNEIGNYSGFDDLINKVVKENPLDTELVQIKNYWEEYKGSGYKSYNIE